MPKVISRANTLHLIGMLKYIVDRGLAPLTGTAAVSVNDIQDIKKIQSDVMGLKVNQLKSDIGAALDDYVHMYNNSYEYSTIKSTFCTIIKDRLQVFCESTQNNFEQILAVVEKNIYGYFANIEPYVSFDESNQDVIKVLENVIDYIKSTVSLVQGGDKIKLAAKTRTLLIGGIEARTNTKFASKDDDTGIISFLDQKLQIIEENIKLLSSQPQIAPSALDECLRDAAATRLSILLEIGVLMQPYIESHRSKTIIAPVEDVASTLSAAMKLSMSQGPAAVRDIIPEPKATQKLVEKSILRGRLGKAGGDLAVKKGQLVRQIFEALVKLASMANAVDKTSTKLFLEIISNAVEILEFWNKAETCFNGRGRGELKPLCKKLQTIIAKLNPEKRLSVVLSKSSSSSSSASVSNAALATTVPEKDKAQEQATDSEDEEEKEDSVSALTVLTTQAADMIKKTVSSIPVHSTSSSSHELQEDSHVDEALVPPPLLSSLGSSSSPLTSNSSSSLFASGSNVVKQAETAVEVQKDAANSSNAASSN